MVITMVLVTTAALFAALLCIIIHQKAQAYQAYRCDEDALGDLARQRVTRADRTSQRPATRLRAAALARRKAAHACGHHVYS